MPFRSKSQQRYFHAMDAMGLISPQDVRKWDTETKNSKGGFKALPEKVTKKASMISEALTKVANGTGVYSIADLPSRRERTPMPKDISSVIDMEHPYLKYLPYATSLVGMAVGHKFYKPNPSVGMIGGMIAGNMVGSGVHAETERALAKPYMKAYSKQVDKKYKQADLVTPGTEYIVDNPINWVGSLKSNAPPDIRASLEYKHPFISRLPVLTGALGGLVSLRTHGLMPLAYGVAGGAIAKELVMDHLMKPYKNKFIKKVKLDYNVR